MVSHYLGMKASSEGQKGKKELCRCRWLYCCALFESFVLWTESVCLAKGLKEGRRVNER